MHNWAPGRWQFALILLDLCFVLPSFFKPHLVFDLRSLQTLTGLGVDSAVAQHLACAYGDRAKLVLGLAERQGLARRLVPGHPYLEAEVLYCVQVRLLLASSVQVVCDWFAAWFVRTCGEMWAIPCSCTVQRCSSLRVRFLTPRFVRHASPSVFCRWPKLASCSICHACWTRPIQTRCISPYLPQRVPYTERAHTERVLHDGRGLHLTAHTAGLP